MVSATTLALLVLGLLLAAAVVSAAFATSPRLKRHSHWPLVAACTASFCLAVSMLGQVAEAPAGRFLSEPLTWFAAGKLKVNLSLAIDSLAVVMLATITFVAGWIAVFSAGYMLHHSPAPLEGEGGGVSPPGEGKSHHGVPSPGPLASLASHPLPQGERVDKGYARYFAVMSLFVFSMCGLVLANNFLLLLAFWEGVGVCSYLLIGYHYERPSAAAAARKAFLVTRLGDVGFVIGIFMLWNLGGWHTDISAVFDHIRTHPPDPAAITTACLLLFCGAIGKSAQFPLYVWLPDAMEGPTPVSALIHAATMVTAGVYLVARCSPLFALSPDAQAVVAWTGGFTAALAAFLALGQYDLKRVLAYSTVSQLGFMFLALGTLGAVAPAFAVTAAVFHLFTHAFFKALLFLAAGSVMHAMGGAIDMRRFGGLRRLMPVTHWTFLCGAAALAGVPLLSGFWSKDLILESLQMAGESRHEYAGTFYLLLLVAVVTAGLTAFYTFRAYFLTFHGLTRVPEEAGHVHVHKSPRVMTIPLLVLALGALAVGVVVEPFTHWFSSFVARTPAFASATAAVPHFNWGIAGLSTLLAVGGIGLAYMAFAGGSRRMVEPFEPIFRLSRKGLFVDDIYKAAIVKPAEGLAFLARVVDQLLDSIARLAATLPRFVGSSVRPIQNGLVQFYALSMVLGLAVFLSFVVFRISR